MPSLRCSIPSSLYIDVALISVHLQTCKPNDSSCVNGRDTHMRMWGGVCMAIAAPSTLYRGLIATSMSMSVVRLHPATTLQTSIQYTMKQYAESTLSQDLRRYLTPPVSSSRGASQRNTSLRFLTAFARTTCASTSTPRGRHLRHLVRTRGLPRLCPV